MASIEDQAKIATAKLAEMKVAYDSSPEQQAARDRDYLKKLQNDPHHLDQKLGGSLAAAAIQARIAQAEAAAAKTENERIDAVMRGENAIAGETTSADQIPFKDLSGAVGDLIESGVRSDLVESFLKTGNSGLKLDRNVEIRAAELWYKRLMNSADMQQRLLAGDEELKRQLAAYAVYSRRLGE